MVAAWLRADPAPSWWRFLVMGVGEGHRFGDLTLRELYQGEVWRLVTCNFVHMSVLHLALNLVAFYLLGTLLESWYGTPQFIVIYLVTGAVGNLLSALVRHAIGSSPVVHSAGGSVVVMGLVGLCAMVGWQSQTDRENDMGWQMTKAIGITALLGIAFHRYIDNWGHAGGAIVGFVMGLFHRGFIRQYHRPAAWGMGVAATLVILASGLAQVSADRKEAAARKTLTEYVVRRAFDDANRGLGIVGLLGEHTVDARVVVDTLVGEHVADQGVILGALLSENSPASRLILKTHPTPRCWELFSKGRTGPSYLRALAIAQAALVRTLSDGEQAAFDQSLGTLSTQILTGFSGLLRQKSTHADFDRLTVLAAAAETRELSDEEKDEFKSRLAPLKSLVQKELEARIREQWRQQQAKARARAGR
jgi:membrane associated rhomboid family serine protease